MPRRPLRNKTIILVRDHEICFLSGGLAPIRFVGESLSQYISRVAHIYKLEPEDLHIISEQGERLLEWIDCEGSKCQIRSFVCISVQRSIEGQIYNCIKIGEDVFGIPAQVRSDGSIETFSRNLCEHLSIPNVWKLHCEAPQIEFRFELRDEIQGVIDDTHLNDQFCPQCFSPFSDKGTGFEAIWFSESDQNMKEATGLWREKVDWTSNQHFCKQCVGTGIVDIYHMTEGEETEGGLRRLLKICPWLAQLSEGDITNTGILFKALNLLFKVADIPELHTGWAEYMSFLPAVQSRLLDAAVPARA